MLTISNHLSRVHQNVDSQILRERPNIAAFPLTKRLMGDGITLEKNLPVVAAQLKQLTSWPRPGRTLSRIATGTRILRFQATSGHKRVCRCRTE